MKTFICRVCPETRLQYFLALPAIVLLGLPLSGRAENAVRKYEHNYKGIVPGVTTVEEATTILGPAKSKTATPNGFNYEFEKVTLNFSGAERPSVNTVIITNDRSYICPNGLRLGDSLHAGMGKRGSLEKIDNKVYADRTHGIVYWCDAEGRITKIVLVNELLRRDPPVPPKPHREKISL